MDLNRDKYEFYPFILETTGAFGPSAQNLCSVIRKITEMKSCEARESPNLRDSNNNNHTMVDPLRASLSVIVQRHNAQMIIERQPPHTKLLVTRIAKCHEAAVRIKEWAKKKLQLHLNGNGPISRLEWECPPRTSPVRPIDPQQGSDPAKKQADQTPNRARIGSRKPNPSTTHHTHPTTKEDRPSPRSKPKYEGLGTPATAKWSPRTGR